ncbi:MAG: hypothetical protein FJ271_24830 [Planctomycetes bacterium]|nr:hypothetical protein [Planctomycetota bacterium]
MNRRILYIVLANAFLSLGASYRTTNFVVHAPTPQIAQQVGQWAEHYRKEKARLWIGQEMPTWPQPCPLIVQVSMEGPSGATSFNFGPSGVMSQKMEIQGPLDRLIASVLPHEITHTVFAYYFKTPVPRWADEGGSVLSEDDLERDRHDKLVRQILNSNRQFPLRRLFSLRDYPREVMNLYAQGFSVSDYLVQRSDRQTFLRFVAHGMQAGWDSAAQSFYRFQSVEELEQAWLQHLRDTKRQPGGTQLAQNKQNATPNRNPAGTMVRLTAPPIPPLDPPPVIRGQSPSDEGRTSDPRLDDPRGNDPRNAPATRPAAAPYYDALIGRGWQPVTPASFPQQTPAAAGTSAPLPPRYGTVQLGAPQFVPGR